MASTKDEGEVVVGLRLPRDLVRAADALIPKLGKTEFRLAGKPSRSMVLRLAITRGLEKLKEEVGTR
jgi:hypothetical protein